MSDAQTAPAVARNRDPILAVLRRVLPAQGTVLEIASGTGEHAVHFAAALPDIDWQPSDPDAGGAAQHCGLARGGAFAECACATPLDVTSPVWPVQQTDAMVCINMIHISPWRAAEALMAGAGRVLEFGGMLFLYGPHKEGGVHTASSNEAFDASLRARNPEWGVRELDDVKALAARHGIEFVERVAMPANNLSVVFRRR